MGPILCLEGCRLKVKSSQGQALSFHTFAVFLPFWARLKVFVCGHCSVLWNWFFESRLNTSSTVGRNSHIDTNYCFPFPACIGCPDWNRCCSHDVFGSCVQCPSWNKCCYKSGDPVCAAHNQGCQHIRKVAKGNLFDAQVNHRAPTEPFSLL